MAYLPLSTANLPDPVIDPAQGASPEDYFGTLTWTGTGGSRTITDGSSGVIGQVNFTPDFVWTKDRSNPYSHILYDAIRGSGVSKELVSNATSAEGGSANTAAFGFLSNFEDGGFDSTSGSTNNTYFNYSGDAYVAWNWKANGSGVTNTDGSITSTVSANTTSGFSIVSYTGTGSNATVGHGLADTPDMVIVKNRSTADGWLVWHQGLSSGTSYLLLHSSSAQASNSAYFNGAPTSTYFNVGTSTNTNGSGNNLIAYCFAEKEGFSKISSYVGNGSADGTFVYCGFKPKFILTKSATTGWNWQIHDTERDSENPVTKYLHPNLSNAEADSSTYHVIDFLSNGFKLRSSYASANESGQTFIYMAFAENPFKFSTAF